MKATVLEIFQDRYTLKHYQVGQVIDLPEERVSDLEHRGLVKSDGKSEVKSKSTTKAKPKTKPKTTKK